jgi:hypothetical protein
MFSRGRRLPCGEAHTTLEDAIPTLHFKHLDKKPVVLQETLPGLPGGGVLFEDTFDDIRTVASVVVSYRDELSACS